MPRTERLLDQVVTSFYDGVLSDEGWVPGLKLLAEATQCQQVCVSVASWEDRSLIQHDDHGLPDEARSDYLKYYHQFDLAWAHQLHILSGRWFNNHRDVGHQEIRASPFYQEFMPTYGMNSILLKNLAGGPSSSIVLSLHRYRGQTVFSDREEQVLDSLIPHLGTAAKLRLRMKSLMQQVGLSRMVLDGLRIPLFVVDSKVRLLFANREAESMLQHQTGITAWQGRLAVGPGAVGKLEQLVKSATGQFGPAVVGGMLLQQVSGRAAFQLLVAPLPPQLSTFGMEGQRLAVVMIHALERPQTAQETLLVNVYGLTPAEARVAQALCCGMTAAQYAYEAGVGLATVRSQIKTIFQKMGLRRQIELVQTLSGLMVFR